MNKVLTAMVAASLTTAVAVASPSPAEPTTKRAATVEWSNEGLKQVDVKGLDVVFMRPGTNLSAYKKIMIMPVTVAFRRDWERSAVDRPGMRIRAEDTQKIKDDLSRVVSYEVMRELGKSGYELVDHAGPDVLEVNVRVAELFLNAPDLPNKVGISQSYAMSFGEMNLVAELRDSSTGDTVMRVLDRNMGRDLRVLRVTTRVENAADIRLAANAWARSLRRELDLAKGVRG